MVSQDFSAGGGGFLKKKDKGAKATLAVDAFDMLNHVNYAGFAGRNTDIAILRQASLGATCSPPTGFRTI
jgi:hypothetical protein